MTSTALVPSAEQAPSAAGSRILTAWRADQQRQRSERAAQAEMAQAMATFRRHQPTLGRVKRQEPAVEAAFPMVSGQRSFGAGETDRLASSWVSSNTSINADLQMALPAMRARSRDWAVNTDLGRRYVTLVQDNIVGGEGFTLQVRAKLASGQQDQAANDAVEAAFAAWSRQCEVTGKLDFVQVCRINVAAAARDGEFLNRRVRDRRLPFGYQLQLLDVDRIYPGSDNAVSGLPQNKVRMGVEIDALGRPVALHLYSQHPYDNAFAGAASAVLERVPTNNLFHGFVLERPEQVRGYPWSHAVLRRANTLQQYESYGLEAAKIGAAKMGFYTIDKDAPSNDLSVEDYKDATGRLIQEVEAGMLEALPPGVGFESFNPDYPHQNFDAFVTKFERRLAAGVNVAHHNLSGDMSGVNYSSARIAELAEREHWRALQSWFIQCFVQPVYEEWLQMALLTGSIVLPSGAVIGADKFDKFAQASVFQPRGWKWVDPKNDVESAALALDRNLTSEYDIAAEEGVDLDRVLDNRKRYMDRLKELGLPLPQPPKPQADQATQSALAA